MKIGILGGAFNPPHKGHLGLARDVKDKLGLERILFISKFRFHACFDFLKIF